MLVSLDQLALAVVDHVLDELGGPAGEVALAADEGAHRGKLASIDIDERIREFIHADIEIEDEN